MTKAVPLSIAVTKKRGKGRPVPGENDVGRERLIDATEQLLRTMPPGHVTISRVAREADVNPALVYYYFGDRAALLLAVVDRVTAHPARRVTRDAPAIVLADHIARTVQLGRRAPFMNRLMIDELAQAEAGASLARVRDMTRELTDFYRDLLRTDGGGELVETDPLYLFIAVLGAGDFLSSAEPLIRQMLPDDADMEKFADGYQQFLVRLLMHGMLKK